MIKVTGRSYLQSLSVLPGPDYNIRFKTLHFIPSFLLNPKCQSLDKLKIVTHSICVTGT